MEFFYFSTTNVFNRRNYVNKNTKHYFTNEDIAKLLIVDYCLLIGLPKNDIRINVWEIKLILGG